MKHETPAPSLSEVMNINLQNEVSRYLQFLDGLNNMMLDDIDNPDTDLNEAQIKFGVDLTLAHSAGNVFLFHLKQVGTVTQNTQ